MYKRQAGGGGCHSNTEYERQKHLRDRNEKFDSHGSDTRSAADNLSNRRIDTGIKERVGDTDVYKRQEKDFYEQFEKRVQMAERSLR